jgi:hypothetical protein
MIESCLDHVLGRDGVAEDELLLLLRTFAVSEDTV